MKKGIFSLMALCLFILPSYGQVKIYIEADDPENLTIIRLRLPILMLTAAGYNASLYDAKFGVDIQPHDRFWFSADYNYSLADRAGFKSSEGLDVPKERFAMSDKEPTKSNYIDFVGIYFFRKKILRKPVRINLHSDDKFSYYTMVDANSMRRLGIRLGYKKGITYYNMNDMLNLNAVNSSVAQKLNQTQDKSTMLQYSHFRIGICHSTIFNLFLKAEKYLDRSKTGVVNMHLDLLVGLSSKVDNLIFVNPISERLIYYEAIALDAYNKKSRFGFETGLRYTPTKGLLSGQVCLGMINGIQKGPNVYFEAGFALSIGKNQKIRRTTVPTLFDSVPRK
jgi:hypothetical protein